MIIYAIQRRESDAGLEGDTINADILSG